MNQPSPKNLRLAAHALRWAAYGYHDPVEQHAVGEVRLWLLIVAGPSAPFPARRYEIAENLELYAINTGQFYRGHMNMVRCGVSLRLWREWVRNQVLNRYRAEIDLVWVRSVDITRCARSLRNYYRQRVREMDRRA